MCSKRCGTLNIKPSEHFQSMNDESDNDTEMIDPIDDDATWQISSVNNFFCLYYNDLFKISSQTFLFSQRLSASPPQPYSSQRLTKQLKLPQMKRFMSNTNEIESNRIDALMAEFFYACNIPLHVCESKYFKNLVGALHPAYEIPNRYRLAAILDKAHSKINQQNSKLFGKMDEQVTATATTTSSSKLKLDPLDTIARVRNMTYNARIGNRLAGDILKSPKFAAIMADVSTVQKEFQRTPLESRLLIAGGSKAVLCDSEHWTSQRAEAVLFLKNLTFMKKVTAECEVDHQNDENALRPNPAVSELLLNVDFVESVENLVNVLDSVAELINYCQQSEVSIADIGEKWLNLLAHESHELRKFADERCTESNTFTNITMTANFVHPDYRGKKLNESQRKDVYDYIFEAMDAEGLESVRLFSVNQGTFESLVKKDLKSPITFWHFARQQGHTQLADFAIELLNLKDST